MALRPRQWQPHHATNHAYGHTHISEHITSFNSSSTHKTREDEIKSLETKGKGTRKSKQQDDKKVDHLELPCNHAPKSGRGAKGLDQSFFLEVSDDGDYGYRPSLSTSQRKPSHEKQTSRESKDLHVLATPVHFDDCAVPTLTLNTTAVSGSISDRPPMPLPRNPSLNLSLRSNSSGSIVTATPVTALREYTNMKAMKSILVLQENKLFSISESDCPQGNKNFPIDESGYINDGMGPNEVTKTPPL